MDADDFPEDWGMAAYSRIEKAAKSLSRGGKRPVYLVPGMKPRIKEKLDAAGLSADTQFGLLEFHGDQFEVVITLVGLDCNATLLLSFDSNPDLYLDSVDRMADAINRVVPGVSLRIYQVNGHHVPGMISTSFCFNVRSSIQLLSTSLLSAAVGLSHSRDRIVKFLTEG